MPPDNLSDVVAETFRPKHSPVDEMRKGKQMLLVGVTSVWLCAGRPDENSTGSAAVGGTTALRRPRVLALSILLSERILTESVGPFRLGQRAHPRDER